MPHVLSPSSSFRLSSLEEVAFSKPRRPPVSTAREPATVDASHHPLQASVLVLNRSYLAVHVVNVRRALCLLYRDIAEVIHVENGRFSNYDFRTWCELSMLRWELERDEQDEFLRTVTFPLQVPRVVRLTRYDRMPKTTVRFNRRNLFARDDHRCQYCGKRFSNSQLSIDHVVPRSRGGRTNWENVVCCCLRCNAKKGGRTPDEARMRLLKRPVRPHSNPHFTAKLRQPRYQIWQAFVGRLSADREQTA